MTRPRAETSHDSAPRRSTATGSSGTTRIRSVCGNARSTTAAADGRQAVDALLDRGTVRARRGCARRTSEARPGPLQRAPERRPRPRSSARRTWRSRARARRARRRPVRALSADRERPARGRKPQHVEAPACAGAWRTFSPTRVTSPLQARGSYLVSWGQLEPRRGTRPRAASSTPNCSQARRRASAISAIASAERALVGVLDEVRVPRRDLGAADPVALQAAGLEHPAGRELVVRVLEDAAESALVRRLGGLPLRLQVGDDRLDLAPAAEASDGTRPCATTCPCSEVGVPVAQPELGRRPPICVLAVDDERAVENRRPVAAVCAGVHPDAAAGGARESRRRTRSRRGPRRERDAGRPRSALRRPRRAARPRPPPARAHRRA